MTTASPGNGDDRANAAPAARTPSIWLRLPAFVVSALVASLLTYGMPATFNAATNPSARVPATFMFPLVEGLLGSLDIWVLLAVAWLAIKRAPIQSSGPVLGLIAGASAGTLYVAAAFAMAPGLAIHPVRIGAPAPHPVALGMALMFTPFVQAKMISLHRVWGWGLDPLSWIIILSPIPACVVGGWLYGRITDRRPDPKGLDLVDRI